MQCNTAKVPLAAILSELERREEKLVCLLTAQANKLTLFS